MENQIKSQEKNSNVDSSSQRKQAYYWPRDKTKELQIYWKPLEENILLESDPDKAYWYNSNKNKVNVIPLCFADLYIIGIII